MDYTVTKTRRFFFSPGGVAAGAKPLLTYLYLVAVDVSDVDND